jgi:hypothetical protein
MDKERLLALGIPTYGRPDFAIKAIENALSINVYDQIIISSNSYEIELETYINNLKGNNISYFQQLQNVGIGKNYTKIIELCDCKYLHIISDEDSTNSKNAKALYSMLADNNDISLIVASVNDIDGNIYKDATWQRNKFLRDSLGETAHIGSTIINVDLWTQEMFKEMHAYSLREGNAYYATAAALLSLSAGGVLSYFPKHIVEMGELHSVSEISGYPIYGFKSRLDQFISIFILINNIALKRKIIIQLYVYYYFAHHALHDAVRKFSENPIVTTKVYLKENGIKTKERITVYLLLSYYYYFLGYYKFKSLVGFILRKIKL